MPSSTCPAGFADRLDRALATLFPGVSRGQARRLIAAGSVFVDGRRCRVASRLVRAGCRLRVEETPPPAARPSFRILHQDDDCLAVDKPAGLPSAPTRRAAAGSVLEELRRQRGDLWLVHRLDHDTSGVLLFARNRDAARSLGDAFRRRGVEKTYLAWIDGEPATDAGRVEARILAVGARARVDDGGDEAETQWSVIERRGGCTLVCLQPSTGRMHQLRVHMAHLGHPVVGDRLYGGSPARRLMLHALRLRFPHPRHGGLVEVEAPSGIDRPDEGAGSGRAAQPPRPPR